MRLRKWLAKRLEWLHAEWHKPDDTDTGWGWIDPTDWSYHLAVGEHPPLSRTRPDDTGDTEGNW